MRNININDFPASCKNYISSETAKDQILLDISNRSGHNHLIRLANKENGMCKEWNTYSIGRDGTIYEHYNPKYYSKFLGIESCNKNNISVVFENMGALIKDSHGFHNHLNEICVGNISEMKYYGYYYWEEITLEQMDSAAELTLYLCNQFQIKPTCIEFDFYHKDISKLKGIAFKSNYFENDAFCIPHFDIHKFAKLLIK